MVAFAAACSTFGGDDSSPTAPSNDASENSRNGDGGVVVGRGSNLIDIVPLERSMLTRGTTASIKVSIARKGSFDGAVIITVRGLPDGIAAKPLRLESPATVGDLELTIASSTPQGDVAGISLEANPSNDSETAIAALPLLVRGAPGELDTTFGTDGFADTAAVQALLMSQKLAVLPDGRFLVFQSTGLDYGSNSVVWRFTAEGQRDLTFGTGGEVVVTAGYIARVFVSEGAILMFVRGTGFAGPFRVQRRNFDGVPDTTYGVGGEYSHSSNEYQTQDDMVLMPGGATAVVGSDGFGTPQVFWISGAGVADAMVNASAFSSFNAPHAIASAVGDATGFVGVDSYGGLARVQRAGGTLDAAFGGAGTGLLQMDGATGLALDSKGRYVIGGSMSKELLTVRLDEKGALDPTFGKQTTPVADLAPLPIVVVQKDDAVVQALRELPAQVGRCGLVRHNSNGTLDTTFGTNGIAMYTIDACRITDVAPLADGRLLVAGAKTFRVWN
ncbi:Hemolysin-type calcium-binding region [Labilithrix luteola]|uniref:Hemolysin-type calcium-binding region n=2 Tax=Labilithrix luteola TaxID=1391654 RepID=A0A0K1Q9R9_9BACT|nr:Hemolysin-type calcium-binding region [Labilithrix luteola]